MEFNNIWVKSLQMICWVILISLYKAFQIIKGINHISMLENLITRWIMKEPASHYWSTLPCLCVCYILQSCPTLCDSMHYSQQGSLVHGILQARIWQWVAIPSSRRSFQPSNGTHISCSSCSAGRSLSLSHWRSPHLILPGGNLCFCPEFILVNANIYNHDVHQLVVFTCFLFFWNKTILCNLFVYRISIPLSGKRFRSNFFFPQIPSLRHIVI